MSKGHLPAEIEVKREANGTRYIFPKRDLRKLRGLGIFLLVFGLVITTFMLFWMYNPISEFFKEDGVMRWFLLVFGLLGTPGLVIGLGIFILGVTVLMNLTRSEIFIDYDYLYSIECFGLIRWKRKRSIDLINDLAISDDIMKTTSQNNKVSYPLGQDASCLNLNGDDMKSMIILPGYPKETIRAFAELLASDVLPDKGGALTMDRKIEIREESYEDEEPEEEIVIERPAKSVTVYQKIDQGCTLTIPPSGLWKGSKGLFFFSLIWNGFMAFFTFFMLKAAFSDSDDMPPVGALLFIGFFWAIGGGLLLGALNMGKRRAIIAVVGDTLGIRRVSLFGTKEMKILVKDITLVQAGPSGMEVNDVPVIELQVFTKDRDKKKKIGMLSQLDNEELEWIAYTLRKELGIAR